MNKKLRKASEMLRKRNLEESSEEDEHKMKKINNQRELTHDKFCWICHTGEETDEPFRLCQSCPRIYHVHCARDCGERCPECLLDSDQHSKRVPRKKLNKLLLSVLGKYLDDEKRKKGFTFQSVFLRWPSNTETAQAVDFGYLVNKTKNEEFSKTSEFLSDVKWIPHNCHITSQSSATIKSALKLVQLIQADIEDIEACHECCDLENQDFVKLCTPPHQIVWAQIYRFPSWPAKCLKVNKDKAYVKFFGTHDIGKLSVKKCHYISRSHPSAPRNKQARGYLEAVEELEEYVRAYGHPFPYYQHRVPFTPENAHKLEILPASEPLVMNHLTIEEVSCNDPLEDDGGISSSDEPLTVEEPMRRRGESFVNDLASFFGVDPKDNTAKAIVATIESAICSVWGIVKGLPSEQEILRHRLQESQKTLEALTAQIAQLQEERHQLIKRSKELEERHRLDSERLSNASLVMKNIRKEYQGILREHKLSQEEKEVQSSSQQTEDIVESYDITVAKRNQYCYVCLKPANSVCCLSASYCSQECLQKDATHHQPLCKQSLHKEKVESIYQVETIYHQVVETRQQVSLQSEH